MPHISSKKLPNEIWQKIHEDFIRAVVGLRTKKEARDFVFDILTPTERVMLAKRFMLIYLLLKKESFLYIENLLKISSSTIIRIAKKLDRGGYKNIQKIIRQNEPNFVEFLEKLLRAGMPPRGKGRWDWLDKHV